jgi:hypothetical protein
MTLCPKCGFDQFVETVNVDVPPILICAQCETTLETCTVLSYKEAELLSIHILAQTWIHRDYYNELHPIVTKIIYFASTGKD